MKHQRMRAAITGALVLTFLISAVPLAGQRLGYNSLNAGNISSLFYNNGFIGDSTNALPSGWWPGNAKNSYFSRGGLWIGASKNGGDTYSVSTGCPGEFFPTADCSTMVSIRPGSRATQELWARFDDANPLYNQGAILNAQVTMRGYQWSFSPVDNFYITEYQVKNNGSNYLSGVYAGFYYDGDVVTTPAADSKTTNYTDFDVSPDDSTGQPRNLVWMTGDSAWAQSVVGFPVGYLGMRLLEARKPNGSAIGVSSARSWKITADPASDANALDLYNRYRYLSANVTDADAKRVINDFRMTTDSIHLKIPAYLIKNIEGVYRINDILHGGTNYFTGGSFNRAGWITLGKPAPDVIKEAYNQSTDDIQTNGAGDTVTAVHVSSVPLDSVAGVWLANDASHTGTNYYTGGSFTSDGWIYLGTPIELAILTDYPIAWWFYKDNNVTVSFWNRYWNESDSPSDNTHVTVGMTTNFDEVEGVYLQTDSLHTGTNYYTGGSFDKATGAITLGTALPTLDPVWVCYRTYAIADYKMLLNAGPFALAPNDSIKAVYATVAGQTLAELRKNSDLAQYMWDHPGYVPASTYGSISGRIKRTDDVTGIENALVKIFQAGLAKDSAWSAVDGGYALNSLEAGSYDSLRAARAAYADSNITGPISVIGSKDSLGFDLALRYQYATIKGKVTRTDGVTPLAGVYLELKGSQYQSAYSDNEGGYIFQSVNPAVGDSIVASLSDYQGKIVPGVVTANDSVTVVNVQMQYLYANITGKITGTDGLTPVAGASVTASGNNSYNTLANFEGFYDVKGMAADTYKVIVSAWGFGSDSAMAVIAKVDSISRIDFSLHQASADGSMRWADKTSLSTKRYGLGSAAVGGKIYVIGGMGENEAVLVTVEEYDPLADTVNGLPWSTKASMPAPRYGLACVSLGDSIIYAIGGYDALENALSTVEAYKPKTNTWLAGFAPMPTPRAYLGIGVLNDTIYAVGGENNSIAGLDTVEAYDPISNSWTTKKSLLGGPNSGRSGLTCATPDSAGIIRLHVVDGKKVDGTYMQTHQKYNQAANTWVARMAPPTPPMAFLASDVIYDSIYCLGGRDLSGYYNSAVTYNPYSNTWRTETPLPSPKAYFGARAIEGNGIYVMGGKSDDVTIVGTVRKGYRYGSISGTATVKISGAAIAGALVECVQGGKTAGSDYTDNNGFYVLSNLEPGLYNVRFYKTGDVDSTINNVNVLWGQNTVLDFVGVAGNRPTELSALIFALYPAYPNPVRNQAVIGYQIPAKALVNLSVYNVLGQKVKTLVNGSQNAGWHSVTWNGRDNGGRKVASGIYLYRLTTGSENAVKKLVVIR